ncbi:PQQ-binding-like beta-propeller repeat protein [Streptomyces sp. NPDC053560]|uniref:protein kinase domain-containing protein n=1 Tax=Streptomyces sp. NPDC053560 TaxID=3365711 RepID=UPI0037D69753
MAFPLTHDDPQRLGRYTLIARLGGGGMGTVYLGRSPGGRTVALKTMHAPLAGQTEFRTRFRLEVDAARVIGGQYGAQVVDADPLAETPWLATEYVLGPPLDDAVALCGPLPEDAVRALGAALCEALGQLHRSDVVHRDLKPSNILLTAAGPKVIDFGIARAAGDDRLTRTGSAAGTPAFMSPEQATAREHTPAGDVFALAGVLVFAATGRAPFGGGQAADLLYRVRYAEPDLTGVPDALRPVLVRCLTKNPADRPGTAELGHMLDDGGVGSSGHFADRLPAAVLADIAHRSAAVWDIRPSRLAALDTREAGDATASAPDDGRRVGRLSRRGLLGIGASVLVAGAVGGGVALFGTETQPPDSGDRKPAGGPGKAPELSWKVVLGNDGQMYTTYVPGDHVAIVTETGLRTVDARTGAEGGTNDMITSGDTVTTDGERLFAVDENEGLRISEVDAATGNFRTPLAHYKGPAGVTPRLLGASGNLIFAQGSSGKEGTLCIAYDKRTGKEAWRHRSKESQGLGPVTPAGRHLITSAGGRMMLLDARSGRTVWTRKLSDPGGYTLGTTPGQEDTPQLVFDHGPDLRAIRLSDGEVVWSFGKGRAPTAEKSGNIRVNYGPPVLKDDVLYCAERDTGLLALDARTGKLIREQEKGTGPVIDMYSTPAVGEKHLYVKPDSGHWAMAIELRTHRTAWTFQGPSNSNTGVEMTALPGVARLLMDDSETVCAIPLE